MREPDRDRWLSIGMSVLLHGTIIGLLAYGWWRYEHRPVTPSVSVDARVVDAQALNGIGAAHHPAPQPKAPPPPAPKPKPKPKPQAVIAPQGPPVPTTAQQLAQRIQAARAEAQHAAAAEAERERLKKQQAAARAKAQAEARKRAEAEKLAQEKRARARARAKRLAEQRRLALERKLAAERAAAARAARIAQLRQALAEDAQSNAKMRAATAGWVSEVTQRVEAAWIKPPSAGQNLSCIVHVTLVKGGAVAGASVGQCNGDEAVRESIVAAVYRASPLPPLPDPALYNQVLNFVFAPQ